MRRQKKNEKGTVAAYLSQKQAMRKLQLGLSNFRRICILKGIYPVEPKNKKKAGLGNSQPKIYFHSKDIAFLAREPLIETFRKLRVHQKRLRRAREKLDKDKEYRLRMNKPTYTLHHLVRERYPTRSDALRDLTDSLNLIFLFARLPRLTQFHPALISLCRRFSVEFLHYVIAVRCIRKAFITIKGFFLEAVIDEIPVVWVIPHQAATHTPTDVDYRLLATCVEFDVTLLGSLLCNLYKQAGFLYPPEFNTPNINAPSSSYCTPENMHFEFLASFSFPIKGSEKNSADSAQLDDLMELQAIDDSVTAAVNKQIQAQRIQHIFDGKHFFFNREVPKEVLTVIIRSCGGDCSWDATSGLGATYTEDDGRIDYQIVDRPMKEMKSTRAYIQPQWVFDSLNAGRLLPTQDYLPSVSLPPHLSPFATALTADPRTAMAEALKQAAAVSAAPGFGTGSALYRPPEVDYLAGLVSLAEVRGAAVAAAQNDETSGNQQKEGGEEGHLEVDEAHVGEEEKKGSKKNKTNKHNVIRALKKGKKAIVKPGQSVNELVVKMAERAEENAQRKLREMMLPKRHKNLYRKMVHAQKIADKDMRQLAERRKAFEKSQRSQRKPK
ncbi:pescadillo [Echinococcus multilocularis]|uniref:Pescadillo homolog n=1 Tax=Echinococcus multilocularis TaxID=6211 RepID=A0A068Y2X7_ECHMU|nr:pescadillo [Echinococcus multilocularis]